MEKRNLTPLRNVLVRYLVVCGGGSIVILLVWWGLFMSLIRNGFLLPPVTGAQVCSEARDYAATATVETFDPNAIDPLCRYAILQAGTAHVLQTNMTASQLKKARNILTGGRQWVVASYQYYQYVVDMADGARCILQYDYSVPYADPALREVLPDFQTMYILLLILLEVIWSALWTSITDGGWGYLVSGVLLYLLRNHRKAQVAVWALNSFLWDFVLVYLQLRGQPGFELSQMFTTYYEWFGVAAAVLMLAYNGTRGSGHKQLFYWFYPAHVYLLYGVSCLVYRLIA